MTLGKAEDGLRKRFSDLYRGKGGGTAGKGQIEESNRDRVTVWWSQCLPADCVERLHQLKDACCEAGECLPWWGMTKPRQRRRIDPGLVWAPNGARLVGRRNAMNGRDRVPADISAEMLLATRQGWRRGRDSNPR